jgi:thiol-disulfide isomerase/thioredoxin
MKPCNWRGIAALALIFAVSAGCKREQPIPEESFWTGTVELTPGVNLPFQMNLDLSHSKPAGYFLIGDEQAPIPEIERNGNDIAFKFSEYGAEMRGAWNGHDWTGKYLRIRSSETKSFNFKASPKPAMTPPVHVDAPPVGNYQVNETTVAKFWAKDGAFFGTFIATDGDYGLLEGRPAGRGIQLNRFTGWQAIAIVLEPGAGGTLSGKLYAAASDKPQDLALRTRTDLNLEPPANQQTAMKNPQAGFNFSGLSLSGETIRSTDDRFKGKALIVDIMGTWCHNCMDEAPVLEQLQKQYGKDGLEIVGLSFEVFEDPALARKNLQLFKDRFGITYTLLFCGNMDDDNVNRQIHSQMDRFFAYPTTIFIDKSHKVQFVHSGFKGPGTGEEFQAQKNEFQDLVRKLGL